MISVRVFKLETTGYKCDNANCQHLPEFTTNIIGSVYHIKTGTICAIIELSGGHTSLTGSTDIYCRGCIDDIYKKIKSELDTNLWAFH